MAIPVHLGKFSLGIGDRFAQESKAQLQACILARDAGMDITPVWNKSNREHNIVGSEPEGVRAAAFKAVHELAWTSPWFVDADHIGMKTVDRFVSHSNFFTLDVADFINKPAEKSAIEGFAKRHPELVGAIYIDGVGKPFQIARADVDRIARKYLFAVQEAGAIYRYISAAKGAGNFVTEVSMDETDSPQTPPELLVILAAIADAGIPIQTIAPKFTGRFNKGVDYVGDVAQFECEFNDDLCVIAHAVENYRLPSDLKLSVHSGSDKFSIYAPIHRALSKHNAGVHVKTAGTTWLEEVIGLAEAGGDGLALAKEIYSEAFAHMDELCAPYASVIDIHRAALPSQKAVASWSSTQYVNALRHDQRCPEFNANLRQLLHVGFKIAAKMGARYLDQIKACEECVTRNVTSNLFDRHIKPLFLGKA